jgi:hypothetical protein
LYFCTSHELMQYDVLTQQMLLDIVTELPVHPMRQYLHFCTSQYLVLLC